MRTPIKRVGSFLVAREVFTWIRRERTTQRSEKSLSLLNQRKTRKPAPNVVSVTHFHVFPRPQKLNEDKRQKVLYLRWVVLSCFPSSIRRSSKSLIQLSSVTTSYLSWNKVYKWMTTTCDLWSFKNARYQPQMLIKYLEFESRKAALKKQKYAVALPRFPMNS